MHHDNGPLGAAAYDRAEERRVELMKKNGFNSIRCAHNPPSSAFLDACDRLGILVIDEFSDMWREAKNPMDYHRFFDDWWKTDVRWPRPIRARLRRKFLVPFSSGKKKH